MIHARIKHWFRYMFCLGCHYAGFDWLYRKLAGPGLVVLMLHRIRDEHDNHPLSISMAALDTLLGWIGGANELIDLDDGLRLLEESRGGTRYALTLDDGYRDNLRLVDGYSHGVPAVVYVVTDLMEETEAPEDVSTWIYRLTHAVEARTCNHLDLSDIGLGQYDLSDPLDAPRVLAQLPPRLKQFSPEKIDEWVAVVTGQTRPVPEYAKPHMMLNWDEVRRLRSHGIEIGAHTRRHVHLSQVDEQTSRDEINGSRDSIASELGARPAHFAYPNGTPADFGDRDVELVRQAGFRTAVTTIEGINRSGYDRFRLLRINVHESRFVSPFGRLSKAIFLSETSGIFGMLRGRKSATA